MKKSNLRPIELSIVIPALNEANRIASTLNELEALIKSNKILGHIGIEIIVVAAKGNDNTAQIAKSYSSRFEHFTVINPGVPVGKGRDVKVGMLAAGGAYIIFMDADLATPLTHLEEFYTIAKKKKLDVVVATRNLRNHHKNLSRRLLSQTGNVLYRIFGGVWIEDSQCGFKLFSKRATSICFGLQTIEKWGFDMEVLAIAKTNNLSSKYIRIEDWKDVPGGSFDATSLIRNALHTLRDLLHISYRRLLKLYLY